jgi:D-tyrosyl-tRNA(Tyr) deacylase
MATLCRRPGTRHMLPGEPLTALRAVVQRVSAARVVVDGDAVGEIGAGLCVLLGVADTDTEEGARRLAGRTARLRIFENAEGKFDRSVLDTRGAVLVVSQFTLIADTAKGNRPSFSHAARAEAAEPLYEAYCNALEAEQIEVARGVFGARMSVQIENDGPVTIVLET